MANTFTPSDSATGSRSSSNREKKPESKAHEKSAQPKGLPLKSTFTAVMLLGGFIIVCWVLVFSLFLSRN